MRILGIDPGSQITGYGVVERKRNQIIHVAHGCIRLQKSTALERRLAELLDQVQSVLERFQPDLAVVERAFVARSARSALILGHARGVAMAVLGQKGVPVEEVAPRTIKQAVVGTGNADKNQVRSMVKTLLALEQRPASDAADALAAAIYQAHTGPWAKLGWSASRRTSSRRVLGGFG